MYANIKGQEIPALGFGTWELTGNTCTRSVEHALDLGYRHIDTAEGYENEEQVGEAIANSGVPREDLFLTTKIWIGGESADRVRKKATDGLRRLNTDYVDLLLIHWPTADMDLKGALDAMQQLRDEERIRNIGVSNFTPDLVYEALEHAPIFCNQIEYHPYLNQDSLVSLAQEKGMMLTAYSPLAKGRIAGDEKLRAIGERHDKTAAQVTLRWLIQQENVTTVPKASSEEHRISNLDIFDFALSDEEMEDIHTLSRNERVVDPEWAPWQ